jgi:hypothetical protein
MTARDLNKMFEKLEARIESLRRKLEESDALRVRLKILSDKMEAGRDRGPRMRRL